MKEFKEGKIYNICDCGKCYYEVAVFKGSNLCIYCNHECMQQRMNKVILNKLKRTYRLYKKEGIDKKKFSVLRRRLDEKD